MRLNYLDTIAGLLIVRMILGHLFQWCGLTETDAYWWVNTVFSFFMPWFFYKSGMLFTPPPYKIISSCNTVNYMVGKTKKILIPYAFFSVFSMLIETIILLIQEDEKLNSSLINSLKTIVIYGAVGSNQPLWFLLTLFLVYILNYYISLKWVNLKLVTAICIVMAILLQYIGYKYPATISSTLIGLSFYLLGMQFKDFQFDKRIVVTALLGIVPMCIYPSVIDVCTNSKMYGNYIVWYLYSLMAIILINNIFRSVKTYSFPLLRYIGRNAITFLITHWIILSIMKATLASYGITSGYIMFSIMLVSMIVILPILDIILNRDKLKVLIGK